MVDSFRSLRLIRAIDNWLSEIDEAKFDPTGDGWVRICWKCLPIQIDAYEEKGFAASWSWEPCPLIFKKCDRCHKRFRRFGEIIPIERGRK